MRNLFSHIIVPCAHIVLSVCLLYGGAKLALHFAGLRFNPAPIISYLKAEIKGESRTCLDVIASGEDYRKYPTCVAEFGEK